MILAHGNDLREFLWVFSDFFFRFFQTQKKKNAPVKEKGVYGTRDSRADTHLGTSRARRCLTAVIRREQVLSMWYGRRH